MPDLKTLQALADELEKTANPALAKGLSFLKNQAGAIGAGGGYGAAIGGLGGLVSGGVSGYRNAKQQGATTGQAALHGLTTGAGRAGKGALLGAAAGSTAGLAGGAGARAWADKATQAKGLLGASSRFGQRQLHGATGYADVKQLQKMRGGSYDAAEGLSAALKTRDPKAIRRATEQLGAMSNAEQAGLTSLPGIAKGLAGRAALNGKRLSSGQALKATVAPAMAGTGLGTKALMLGFPALGVGSAVADKNATPGQRLGRAAGAVGTGLMYASPLAAIPQMAGASALAAGTDIAGRSLDRGLEALK
jgi:hypothetical protein